MKSSVVTLLCRLELIVGDAVTELRNQNEVEAIGSGVTGAKWWHSATIGKVDMVSRMDG